MPFNPAADRLPLGATGSVTPPSRSRLCSRLLNIAAVGSLVIAPSATFACSDVPAADLSMSASAGSADCTDYGMSNIPWTALGNNNGQLRDETGCYSLVHMPEGTGRKWLMLMSPDNKTLYPFDSTDDGITWSGVLDGSAKIRPQKFGINNKCSDLVWEPGSGTLHVYVTSNGGTDVYHGSSTDRGDSWIGSSTDIVLSPGAAGSWDELGIENPCVIDVGAYDPTFVAANPGRRFVLAYAGTGGDQPPPQFGCTIPLNLRWNGIGLAFSSDWAGDAANGYRFTRLHNQGQRDEGRVLAPDLEEDWQNRQVYRPRLVVGPNPTGPGHALYLFYVGAGSLSSNECRCQAIGYGISTDWGMNWKWGGRDFPAFEGLPYLWNQKDSYCPDLVDMGNDLRLYYLGTGRGTTVLGGVETAWANLGFPPRPAANHSDLGLSIPTKLSDGVTTFLRASPNPASGGVSLRIAEELRSLSGTAEVTAVDVSGRSVATLWSGDANDLPGEFEWDGTTRQGSTMVSGRVFLVLSVEGRRVATAPITLRR